MLFWTNDIPVLRTWTPIAQQQSPATTAATHDTHHTHTHTHLHSQPKQERMVLGVRISRGTKKRREKTTKNWPNVQRGGTSCVWLRVLEGLCTPEHHPAPCLLTMVDLFHSVCMLCVCGCVCARTHVCVQHNRFVCLLSDVLVIHTFSAHTLALTRDNEKGWHIGKKQTNKKYI